MLHDVLDSDLANRWTDIIPLYREASCTSRESLKLFFCCFSPPAQEKSPLKNTPPPPPKKKGHKVVFIKIKIKKVKFLANIIISYFHIQHHNHKLLKQHSLSSPL